MQKLATAVLLVFPTAATAALAGAATAHPYTPYLYVHTLPARSSVQFSVVRSTTDLATYTAEIRVPSAYGAKLDQPVGTQVGTVTAQPLDPSQQQFSGAITAGTANPNNGCFSVSPQFDSAWDVTLTDGSRTFAYQIYIDVFRGDLTLLRYCLPPATGDLGAMVYTVNGVFTQPARGIDTWRCQFYPYTADGQIVDNAAGVGAAALVRLPHAVSLNATVDHSTGRYTLRGSVTERGIGVRYSLVLLSTRATSRGAQPLAHVKTDRHGRFTYSAQLSKRSAVRVSARALTGGRVISPPRCPAINGWPCLTETVGPWEENSRAITIRP